MSWRGFEELDEAIELALETVRMVAAFEAPAFAARRLLVSLRHPDEYPMNEGRIVSNDGLDLAAHGLGQAFREEQVEGRAPSMRGPLTARRTCSDRRPASHSPATACIRSPRRRSPPRARSTNWRPTSSGASLPGPSSSCMQRPKQPI